MDNVQVSNQILSIFVNVKINEDSLPRYYPLKYTPNRTMFEEVDLTEFALCMLEGKISLDMLQDLQGLNSYLIGKLGKSQASTTNDPKAIKLIKYLEEKYS